MTTSSDPTPSNLAIMTLVELPPTSLEGFCLLVQELLPLAAIPHPEHFSGIIIVQDGQMAEAVNTLLREAGVNGSVYAPGAHAAQATAVPIEHGDVLSCFVLIEDSLIRPLTPQRYRIQPITSTLLEELLHIRVYSGIMPQLHASGSSSAGDRSDGPLVLCLNALNEYLTIRWKAHLLSSLPLTEVNGGYSPVVPQYPIALGPVLDDAGKRIKQLVAAVAGRATPYETGWHELLQLVYRGILEPLARERAYRDGCVLEPVPIFQPSVEMSRFYMRHVAPFWDRWLPSMLHAADVFDGEPAERLAALLALRETLLHFLRHIGVEYELRPGGQCHVMFDGWTGLSL